MKASVVIPIHNKAPYLRECLESVLGNTWKEIEVICVDDASTDDSLKILHDHADTRLKIVELERNVGPGLAVQHAHDIARGEYLIRVDADDVQHSDRFQRQLAFMEAHPSVGISGSALRLLGTEQIRRKPPDHEACYVELLFRVAVQQPTMIIRRQVLLDHGIRYRPEWPWYGEDWLLQLQLAEVTHFANIPEVLVEYRQGGISSNTTDQQLHILLRDVFSWAGLPDPSEEDLRSHQFTAMRSSDRIDADAVSALSQWLRKLGSWNDRAEKFDRTNLKQRLEQLWDDLFFRLPGGGIEAVFAWMKAGGKLTPRKLYYLLRSIDIKKQHVE